MPPAGKQHARRLRLCPRCMQSAGLCLDMGIALHVLHAALCCVLQNTVVLQKEAGDLSNRAEAELQGLVAELTRVHRLVAHFQDQIREVCVCVCWLVAIGPVHIT